jgi:hypothetical protein
MHISLINTATLSQAVNTFSAEAAALAHAGSLTDPWIDAQLDALLATADAMAAQEKLDAYEVYDEMKPLIRALRSASGRRASRRTYIFNTWRRLAPLLKINVAL